MEIECIPVENYTKTQALIKIAGGAGKGSSTYVNRILSFIFATDDSFTELQRLPQAPFKMSCGFQRCINLAHVSLGVDEEFL